MSVKHFIDDPESLVLDCLEALTLINPQVILDKASKGIRSNPNYDAYKLLTLARLANSNYPGKS